MTEPKVINATDLRNHMRDIIEQAKFKGRHYIVQTHGKPMVAIMGYEEYARLVEEGYWGSQIRSHEVGISD